MKKSNFKKMALLGMAGGMLIAGQTPVNANTGTLLAGGCGSGSCGGYKGGSTENLPGYYHQSQNPSRGRHSCSSAARSYTADASADVQTQATQSGRTITESEFLSQLNDQGKALFQSLSPEGKALAVKLANDGSFQDKNAAVKEAAKKIAEKRNITTTKANGS